MSQERKTNICCLDLQQPCLDYINSLNLAVFEGSLGSVVNIDWSKTPGQYEVPVLVDYSLPRNIQEYHVFIYDMGHEKTSNYVLSANSLSENVTSKKQRYLECSRPITKYDLRPYSAHVLSHIFESFGKDHKRISIVFISEYREYEYTLNEIGHHMQQPIGPFNNYACWIPFTGQALYGNRVKTIEGQPLSTILFQEHLGSIEYYRVFDVPTMWEKGKHVPDESYIPLLTDEEGHWVAFAHAEEGNRFTFIFPQVKDKEVLLKSLFENVLFSKFSDFFPDIEENNWIREQAYELPNERVIRERIEEKSKAYKQELAILKEEEKKVRDSNSYLKLLLTGSGSDLVGAVKSFLEYLGFIGVVDRDEILKNGEKKEEDLFLEHNGELVIIEVKGINGTSTDSECSQIDKIVPRRMREKGTHLVHGVYVVNNQKNVAPLSRMIPPFNTTQIDDAVSQSRTMVYTTQLFSLYSDIENGFVSKDDAREQFLIPGLADFHKGYISLGVPPKFYKDRRVLCFHLKDTPIKKGDTVFFKDNLNRLVGAPVLKIVLDGKDLEEASTGDVSIEVDTPFPKNSEVFIRKS